MQWANQTCRLILSAFVKPGERAQPSVLEFQGVTHLSVPRHDEWGPSSSVNGASSKPGHFAIEMQSGDVIDIKAQSFSFGAR